jgi:hypothetical protein
MLQGMSRRMSQEKLSPRLPDAGRGSRLGFDLKDELVSRSPNGKSNGPGWRRAKVRGRSKRTRVALLNRSRLDSGGPIRHFAG